MWRRVSSDLAAWKSSASLLRRRAMIAAPLHSSTSAPSPPHKIPPLFSDSANVSVKKRAEDVVPTATGLEREEIQAELEGRKRFDMDAPVGPFGTKEAPAVVQSWYNKRIVGCPGGEGEDEHDVVWFWLDATLFCSSALSRESISAGSMTVAAIVQPLEVDPHSEFSRLSMPNPGFTKFAVMFSSNLKRKNEQNNESKKVNYQQDVLR